MKTKMRMTKEVKPPVLIRIRLEDGHFEEGMMGMFGRYVEI